MCGRGQEGRRGGGKVCRSEYGGWELEEGKPNLPASKFRMLVTTAAVYIRTICAHCSIWVLYI